MDLHERRVLRRKTFLLRNVLNSYPGLLHQSKAQGLIKTDDIKKLQKASDGMARASELLALWENNGQASWDKLSFLLENTDLAWLADELNAELELEKFGLNVESHVMNEAKVLAERYWEKHKGSSAGGKEELAPLLAGRFQVAKEAWRRQLVRQQNAMKQEKEIAKAGIASVMKNVSDVMEIMGYGGTCSEVMWGPDVEPDGKIRKVRFADSVKPSYEDPGTQKQQEETQEIKPDAEHEMVGREVPTPRHDALNSAVIRAAEVPSVAEKQTLKPEVEEKNLIIREDICDSPSASMQWHKIENPSKTAPAGNDAEERDKAPERSDRAGEEQRPCRPDIYEEEVGARSEPLCELKRQQELLPQQQQQQQQVPEGEMQAWGKGMQGHPKPLSFKKKTAYDQQQGDYEILLQKLGSRLTLIKSATDVLATEKGKLQEERKQCLQLLKISDPETNLATYLGDYLANVAEELSKTRHQLADKKHLAQSLASGMRQLRLKNEHDLEYKDKVIGDLRKNMKDKEEAVRKRQMQLNTANQSLDSLKRDVRFWKQRCEILEQARRLGNYLAWWMERSGLSEQDAFAIVDGLLEESPSKRQGSAVPGTQQEAVKARPFKSAGQQGGQPSAFRGKKPTDVSFVLENGRLEKKATATKKDQTNDRMLSGAKNETAQPMMNGGTQRPLQLPQTSAASLRQRSESAVTQTFSDRATSALHRTIPLSYPTDPPIQSQTTKRHLTMIDSPMKSSSMTMTSFPEVKPEPGAHALRHRTAPPSGRNQCCCCCIGCSREATSTPKCRKRTFLRST